jgi:hypothetical protein
LDFIFLLHRRRRARAGILFSDIAAPAIAGCRGDRASPEIGNFFFAIAL